MPLRYLSNAFKNVFKMLSKYASGLPGEGYGGGPSDLLGEGEGEDLLASLGKVKGGGDLLTSLGKVKRGDLLASREARRPSDQSLSNFRAPMYPKHRQLGN